VIAGVLFSKVTMSIKSECIERLNKIRESGETNAIVSELFKDLTDDPSVMRMVAEELKNDGVIFVDYQSGQLHPYVITLRN